MKGKSVNTLILFHLLQDMAAEQKTSATTIGDLRTQLDSFAGRLGELENLREQQEGTIKVKQEENTVASTQIKVAIG